MRTWLTDRLGADAADSARRRPAKGGLRSAVRPLRPGALHEVSLRRDRAGEGFKINWLTSRPMPDERPFTKFAHVPHFSLLGEKAAGPAMS